MLVAPLRRDRQHLPLARGVTQDAHALALEPCVAPFIPQRPVAAGVGFAVHLDREPRRGAVEVQHVSAGGVLAAEAQAGFVVAECEPERD